MNRGVFVYLELLKWMVRGCEPHLAQVYGGTEKKYVLCSSWEGEYVQGQSWTVVVGLN